MATPKKRVRRKSAPPGSAKSVGPSRTSSPARSSSPTSSSSSPAPRRPISNAFACVGLIVLAGCFTVVMIPDSEVPWLQVPKAPKTAELPTIVIDAGHGGNDDGAIANGLAEKNLNLDVALRLEKALTAFNFPVVLTRQDDHYVSLAQRAAIANRVDHAFFVSIHFNKHNTRESGGIETFYSDLKSPPADDFSWMGLFSAKPAPLVGDTGEELASFIQTALILKTNLRNRGIKSRGLYVTRNVRHPAALVEAGFISNPVEAALLRNSDYRQRLASGIAEGVLSYYRSRPTPGQLDEPGTSPTPDDRKKLVQANVE